MMTKLIELNTYIEAVKIENPNLKPSELANKINVNYRTLWERLNSDETVFIDPKTLVHYHVITTQLSSDLLNESAADGSEVNVIKLSKAIDKYKRRNVAMAAYAREIGCKKTTLAEMMKRNGENYLVSTTTGRIYAPKRGRYHKNSI